MHEESHELEKSYEDEDSQYRHSRFGKTGNGRGNMLNDGERDPNDTYQDIDDEDEDPENMESRAEYNSEEDEDMDQHYRSKRDGRYN